MRALLLFLFGTLTVLTAAQPPARAVVDRSGWRAESGATLQEEGNLLRLTWPISRTEAGELALNLAGDRPLIESISVIRVEGNGREFRAPLLKGVDPVTLLTVGERDMSANAGWVTFFDSPILRAHTPVPVVLKKTHATITSVGNRTTVRIGEITAGSFRGAIEFTVSRNSPLVHAETVISTQENGRAIVYDAGLASTNPDWRALAWRDADGKLQHTKLAPNRAIAPLYVKGRAVAAECEFGCVAVLPSPHQYFYPLDFADNLGYAWQGASGNALLKGYGFGIRQPLEGDRRFAPWFNAPPGTEQRLGVFYFISSGDASHTLDAIARLTHGDRYKKLPGYHTFTSHYHIEHTLEFMKAQREQNAKGVPAGLESPGLVQTFKDRGIEIAHLAEFHNGATPRLPVAERLAQLKTLHAECARLSDDQLLLLPGEEPNVHLGGHWLSFFPKPVYWVLHRNQQEPFQEELPGYGTVYHVGSPEDVLQLMQREHGLMWTAHARVKGSRGFPDAYWEKPFYRSDQFLGAAWKAMPADLSLPRLGPRVLDLLDDMSNAGMKKFVIGEADLFRMEPDYETYAHLNINYVQLDQVPKFGDGWQPLLDALRAGKFFVTTGEILLPRFSVGGKASGETLRVAGSAPTTVEVALEWTFPLAFAEIISGDGKNVYRQRIELTDTESHGERVLRIPAELAKRTWVRFEVWDIARNGAFTEPVFLEAATP